MQKKIYTHPSKYVMVKVYIYIYPYISSYSHIPLGRSNSNLFYKALNYNFVNGLHEKFTLRFIITFGHM